MITCILFKLTYRYLARERHHLKCPGLRGCLCDERVMNGGGVMHGGVEKSENWIWNGNGDGNGNGVKNYDDDDDWIVVLSGENESGSDGNGNLNVWNGNWNVWNENENETNG
jgi:hypothetical protein